MDDAIKGKKKVGKSKGLFKRPDSPFWWYDIAKPDGKREKKSTKTTDLQEAKRYHDELKASFWKQEKLGALEERTWDEAVKKFLMECRVEKKSATTLRDYKRQLDWWGENYFGKVKLHKIKKGQIMEGIYKVADTSSQLNANRYLASIRRMLNKAVDPWGWIESAPSNFKQFDEKKFARKRNLTDDQISRLFDELPQHQQAMFAFDLVTGLRQANVRLLEWSWIDMQNKVITIPGDKFKNRQDHVVPLNEVAIALIKKQIGKDKKYLFVYNGNPVTSVSTKAWAQAKKRAGIEDYRWHDNRHTWATMLRRLGVDLADLQDLGGWKSAEMVRRYAHADMSVLQKKADSLVTVGSVSRLIQTTSRLRHVA